MSVCDIVTDLPSAQRPRSKTRIHSPLFNKNLTITWKNAVFYVVVFGCQPEQQKIRRHSTGVINFCTVSLPRRVGSHGRSVIAVEDLGKKKLWMAYLSTTWTSRFDICCWMNSLFVSHDFLCSWRVILCCYAAPAVWLSVYFSRRNVMSTQDAKSKCSEA